MKPDVWRLQLGAVATGYLAVSLVAVALVYHRHLQYANHPADVIASGGMYAFGDWILELFIIVLFLLPTFGLVLVIRNFESAYARYSQTLLGLSITSPVCLGLFLIPAVNQSNSLLGEFCVYRLFGSPFVLVGLAASRILARFARSRRLISYALLIEAGTIALMVLLLLVSARGLWS
ncbi:MAG TPA: hypothetical protein VFB00_07650 [Terriglobales bacterium]|nr:hypothetical protein [Terriglobales bacterium]